MACGPSRRHESNVAISEYQRCSTDLGIPEFRAALLEILCPLWVEPFQQYPFERNSEFCLTIFGNW